jgi:hypothetical protein
MSTSISKKRGGVAKTVSAITLALGLAVASAVPAQAVQTNVILGPKTCSGSSFLASTANATIHVSHQITATSGAWGIRKFNNATGTYQVSNYYAKFQGTVIYNGHSFVTIDPSWESGTIGSASLFCDV